MSKSARPGEAAKNGNVPFEEALKKLESIVETMESEDLPLETLLPREAGRSGTEDSTVGKKCGG
jgi:hypothetical protein